MNSRLFPALIIIFILLAGMIIYIDIQPGSSEKELAMPDVKEVRISENKQRVPDIDVYFNTKEIIKKRGELEETIESDTFTSAEQNPFLFPEEILLLKLGKESLSDQELADINDKIMGCGGTDKIPSGARFHLSMIMIGQNQKFALVNQEFVIEGDHVEDFKVEKISKKSITLVNKDEIKEIQLEPGFLPLMHKSSYVQTDMSEGNETIQEVESSNEAGNLKKQLQDVLEMYE